MVFTAKSLKSNNRKGNVKVGDESKSSTARAKSPSNSKADAKSKKSVNPKSIAATYAKISNKVAKAIIIGKGSLVGAGAGVGAFFIKKMLSLFMGMFLALKSAVVGGITAAITAVSTLFGVTSLVATVAVLGVGGSIIVFAVSAIGGIYQTSNAGAREGSLVTNCVEKVDAVRGDGAEDEDNSYELYNAQLVYSVFKAYGLNDEAIAGVLGNWSAESMLDPTCIEGIYTEPYDITAPRKAKAVKNLDDHTRNYVFPMYDSAGLSINKAAYKGTDGRYYCGVGLGQWTGPGAQTFLSVANSVNRQWYTIDFQIAYSLSGHYRPDFFPKWLTIQHATPEEAALYFSRYWEGNTTYGQERRQTEARRWFDQMGSWEVDSAYVDSILALSQQMGMAALDNVVALALRDCVGAKTYDNTSMALAAVSYAYPVRSMGVGNNGTALYRHLHDTIFPGDPLYMSCDRGVSTAIRWSGSDDTFPVGSTAEQYNYVNNHPEKWMNLGPAGSLAYEDLLPGDIFLIPRTAFRSGHIFMYVSSELIQQVHGSDAELKSDSVSASYGERSPGCGNDTASILSRNGDDWVGRGQYTVYRCVAPDNSPKYQNAGSGV